MTKDKLTKFLNGEAMDGDEVKGAAAPVDGVSVVAIAVSPEDPFRDILARLCAVEMLAKDLHYRSRGKAFYGEHLLADLIADIGKASDDVNEVRYMGELGKNPPLRVSVARMAAKIVDLILYSEDEDDVLYALSDAVDSLVRKIEEVKDAPVSIASGTVAVLDAISQKALQASGFLKRVMNELGNGEVVEDGSLL